MVILLTFLIGAVVGAFIQTLWGHYLEDGHDATTIARYERSRQAINPRRWD